MDPDIGASQWCLKGQITPEHQGLGTEVRQPRGTALVSQSLTGALPQLGSGCFEWP